MEHGGIVMNRHFVSKTFWGLLFIAAGVLFLLHQQDIIHIDIAEIAGTYWPVILILVGLQGMAAASGGIWNIFIMLLGGYFLLRNLDVAFVQDMEIRQFAIPAVLIILGLSMLTRGSNRKREEKKAMLRQERHEERERRRQERDERRDRRHHHSGSAVHTPHEEPEEVEVPPFDPSYSRKIEQDLDKVFHERVVKKLGEDPFPMA